MKSEIFQRGAQGLISHLAEDKKRTAVVLCLVALMALMWVKAFGTKARKETSMTSIPTKVEASAAGLHSDLKMSFIKLPEVVGRNDVLKRDYFAANGWWSFTGQSPGRTIVDVETASVALKDGSEDTIRQVAAKLKLEAIALDESAQAFVNNRLLRVGDTLDVKDGAASYEFEVLEIAETTVLMRCGKGKVTLKLASASDETD